MHMQQSCRMHCNLLSVWGMFLFIHQPPCVIWRTPPTPTPSIWNNSSYQQLQHREWMFLYRWLCGDDPGIQCLPPGDGRYICGCRSQMGFESGPSVWLSVHILTQAYDIWRKPLFCAVWLYTVDVNAKKTCMNVDIGLLRWSRSYGMRERHRCSWCSNKKLWGGGRRFTC